MMFKHALQVKPFISIRYVYKPVLLFVSLFPVLLRRPFGVEEEYFVQLFLEMDDTQKLPSIGDLVDKMFTEQNISFTKVVLLYCWCITVLAWFTHRFLQNCSFKCHDLGRNSKKLSLRSI